MSYEQCTYLLDTAVDSLQTSSSDTNQLSLLSGMDMPAKSSESAQQTDGFPACECGKGTSDCSIHPNTRDKWIASMQDSLAKTLALLESRQVYLREPDQVFTVKSCASLTWLDQSSFTWKTSQRSLVTGWEPYSQTWPRWGMTVGGSAFAHPMSERPIRETDGSYLPTPTVTTGAQVSWDKTPGQTGGTSLAGWVKYWPTPTAHNAKETNAKSEMNRNTPTLAAQVGGKLNPQWVEWLMGFPIGFTDSKDWVTRKSPCKPQPPTDCLEVTE